MGQPAKITLKPGLVIRQSGTVAKRVYRLPNAAEDGNSGVVSIEGNNLTVDFAGATLQGSDPTVDPDERKGTGIIVRGRNITLKNLKVRGYKIGLAARNSPGIKILDSDLSYNWKQRLMSTLDREDGADWMSFHRNEKDEWLRFGAGIYLRDCDRFEVRNVTIRGGQCGLMLTGCNGGLAWNNDFSFLSAIGIGMYLSSSNRIMHNKVDWCVRGYSHGKWNRGQDSAGILIYEQSHRNTFAYNSVTHGGDGFFLWAGQTTMDDASGGCNDNLLYGNDWSHAPTNGIEATFSRNDFVNNLIMECWHGIWGGYSYESKVLGNVFAYNAEGIALEHGQDNSFIGNVFYRDTAAMVIWQNASQDPNWGYPKHRDTRSRNYVVEGNHFAEIPGRMLSLRDTLSFKFGENRFGRVRNLLELRGNLDGFRFPGARLPDQQSMIRPLAIDGKTEPVMVEGSRATLPALMQGSGNVVMPYPDKDYLSRFKTNWNPLKAPKAPITVGVEPQGAALGRIPDQALGMAPKPLAGGKDPFIPAGQLRGRRYILVDNWGPYDFRSPLIWPRGIVTGASADALAKAHQWPANSTIQEFEILGPKGQWRVVGVTPGVKLSANSGQTGQSVYVTAEPGKASNLDLRLEYVGEKTVDYRGVETAAGKAVRFGYRMFFAPIQWTVRFYPWVADVSDPRTQDVAWRQTLVGTPLAEVKTDRLDYMGFGAFAPGVPNKHFTTLAEGRFEIEPGDYVLEITTDDGMRAWLDGKPLFAEAWKYQGPTLYTAEVKLGGSHQIRLEHFQIDGYAALKVNLRPKS